MNHSLFFMLQVIKYCVRLYVAVTHSYMLLFKQVTVFVVVEVSYTNVQNLCKNLAGPLLFKV
jgi:hypothetical protein